MRGRRAVRCRGLVVEGAILSFVFFFQAEDGIRDIGVTGVQTCALPIFSSPSIYSGVASGSWTVAKRCLGAINWKKSRITPSRGRTPIEIGRASCRERV